MILNSVHFGSIDNQKRYTINAHYVRRANNNIPREIRSFYLELGHCILVKYKYHLTQSHDSDKIEFHCLDKGCDKRLLITRRQLPPLKSAVSQGSLLVEVTNRCCHSCGKHSRSCCEDWVGHYLCENCRFAGKEAPYPYGFGVMARTSRCCDKNGCGEKAGLTADVGRKEDDLGLFEFAVQLQKERIMRRKHG